MDDLPELPFLKVLSYLSLKDRLMLRAVSRSWYHKITNSRVKSLCFSERPIELIRDKSRWISGAFVQNFIHSTRFATFFNTYSQTILSNLKRLRLCDLDLNHVNGTLAETLNSFGQLEELAMDYSGGLIDELELNLPKLHSIQLVRPSGIMKLTLDAPKLKKAFLLCYCMRLVIVHGESLERLVIGNGQAIEVNSLKNLQQLCIEYSEIYPKFSSCLQHLKEIHLYYRKAVLQTFDLMRLHERTDLKIYYRGLLLNGPDDPAIDSLTFPNGNLSNAGFVHLVENLPRLADEIPFSTSVHYSAIESVAPGAELSVLNRFAHFGMTVSRRVQDIDRFLDLMNLDHLTTLAIWCNQPKDLFDRLPEHCTVQALILKSALDCRFLFRLKHLSQVLVVDSMGIESIRSLLEQHTSLRELQYSFRDDGVTIQISKNPKRFSVSLRGKEANVWDVDVDAAIQFILENRK